MITCPSTTFLKMIQHKIIEIHQDLIEKLLFEVLRQLCQNMTKYICLCYGALDLLLLSPEHVSICQNVQN